MKNGILILLSPLNNNALMKAIGIIHNARASFKVVAVNNASSQYAEAAPTTEEVSCMAIALQTPKAYCSISSKWPINGKTNKATELRINIVTNANEV